MSDDEVDYELLDLLRQSLGITNRPQNELSADTGVLRDAEYIYNNAIDVSIDMWGTKSAAKKVWKIMQDRSWSAKAWSEHELHPSLGPDFNEAALLNFVFTMDLLNFSFWSELSEQDRFQVEYQGKRWTGYMSLVASLRRALDENVPMTTPRFWRSKACTDLVIENVFRSATREQMPLLEARIAILREAAAALKPYDDPPAPTADELPATKDRDNNNFAEAKIAVEMPEQGIQLSQADAADVGETNKETSVVGEQSAPDSFAELSSGLEADGTHATPAQDMQQDLSVQRLVAEAGHSAGKLVNLIVSKIPSFDDACRYEGRKVRLLKRAQIFVADVYGAFQGEGLGDFPDIGHLTMFADYRVPQVLHNLGVLTFCPALEAHIRRGDQIPPQSSWEVQLRGCSIYATELLRREIIRSDESARGVNAVLIDFLLYDLAKEWEFLATDDGTCVRYAPSRRISLQKRMINPG